MRLKSAVMILTLAAGLPAIMAAQRLSGAGATHGTAPVADARESAGGDAIAIVQDTAAGHAIFTGKGACFACHGPDAKGTPLAPNLTDSTWLHIDGSLDAIVKLVTEGVPTPKNAPAPMPPKGGAALTDVEIRAVASYVYSLSHSGGGH